jgi:hypothetical protein
MTGIFGRGIFGVYQIQSAFDAFPSTGNWIPLSAYELSNGENRPQEVDPQLGRGFYNNRDPVSDAPGLPNAGGAVVIPLCLREIGYWLCATFGAPETTEDAGVYTHVWESGKDVLQTLAQSKFLKANMYRRGRGLAVNTFAMNLTKVAGYQRVQLGILQRDEERATAQASGTILPAMEQLLCPAASPFVTFDGNPLPATAHTWNFSNQIARFDPLNGNEYPAALDPEDVLNGGSFTIRKETEAMDILADARTPKPMEFGHILPHGLGENSPASLKVLIERTKIDRNALPINTPGRLFQTHNFTGEQNSEGPAARIELVNDVSGYPPPPPPPPPPPGP